MKPINWSSEAEVTNFDRAVSVYKYITRLQITMNDLSIMHVLQAVEDAPNEVFDLDDFQIVLGFDYFPEITVTVVHDKVDSIIFLEHVVHINDKRVLDVKHDKFF